ncbi:hypothetical protein B0H14DRAFT_2571180 [Mycena olivaceomarginata]|nr:hypothetical protein B0H14DRAFT_2571180 [Mycena olivaceomarginata]
MPTQVQSGARKGPAASPSSSGAGVEMNAPKGTSTSTNNMGHSAKSHSSGQGDADETGHRSRSADVGNSEHSADAHGELDAGIYDDDPAPDVSLGGNSPVAPRHGVTICNLSLVDSGSFDILHNPKSQERAEMISRQTKNRSTVRSKNRQRARTVAIQHDTGGVTEKQVEKMREEREIWQLDCQKKEGAGKSRKGEYIRQHIPGTARKEHGSRQHIPVHKGARRSIAPQDEIPEQVERGLTAAGLPRSASDRTADVHPAAAAAFARLCLQMRWEPHTYESCTPTIPPPAGYSIDDRVASIITSTALRTRRDEGGGVIWAKEGERMKQRREDDGRVYTRQANTPDSHPATQSRAQLCIRPTEPQCFRRGEADVSGNRGNAAPG